MKINGFLLADKSQNVPIPIPGEEVTTGWTLDLSQRPTAHYSVCEGYYEWGYHTDHWNYYDVSANSSIHDNGYEYESEGWLPSNRDWEIDVRAEQGWDVYDQWQINNVTGNVKISGLQAGKYVIVLEHYLGRRGAQSKWSGTDVVSNPIGAENIRATKIIRQGTYGVVYGELNEDYNYTHPNASYSVGCGSGTKFTQKCAVTVSDPSEVITITYGDDSFRFSDLCDVVGRNRNSSGNPSGESYILTTKVSIRVRVYTAA